MPLPENTVIDLFTYSIEVSETRILILGCPVRLVADDVSVERSSIDLIEIVRAYGIIASKIKAKS